MKDIYIDKLLSISSESISNRIGFANITNDIYSKLLNKKNGFYAFASALHIFSVNEQRKLIDILNRSDLYDTNCFYFAEDIFGNLFCEKNGKYYLIDIETGSYEYIADSLDNWAKEILNNYNYFTGYELAYQWQKQNGKLKNNERLIPKVFFILGGEYKIDNLYNLDRLKALELRLDIYNQLKDINDGESIIIE